MDIQTRSGSIHQMKVFGILLAATVAAIQLGGCSTAPKVQDREAFLDSAESTTRWFERNVYGLRRQIDASAGYLVFPGVAQWGTLIGGGTAGRGALYTPDGRQIGWAAINIGSIGLQVGVQGFRMLMVLEDETALQHFKANLLTGSVDGVAVAVEAGGSGAASFTHGVAVYQGANVGLMAGMNIGLNYIRYEPL